ncbi:Cationic amino acid transporter 2, vacuolar [Vitis vinifera]|uniref:Cationic amino acid transporter 2, vacuolar n=1 Tax=Vitis vinifera TaxID=29760 RepID=A0A438DI43_VITVI|nr:Cationic amino acid transporter 2, vacuolar [Vitis vinifera]
MGECKSSTIRDGVDDDNEVSALSEPIVVGVTKGSTFSSIQLLDFDMEGRGTVELVGHWVKNPQKDLPLGIGLALAICCILYMLVSVVIVGLVPFYELNADTPISSAFSSYGMKWAAYTITTGAVTALVATLMGSILPQPRILMAMARDGLLPSFFSDINKHTHVPVKSTILTGIFAATLAFFMDVSQLAGMVSVGTLLAFTTVAISVLILRYVPPEEVPLVSSLQESLIQFPRNSIMIHRILALKPQKIFLAHVRAIVNLYLVKKSH